MRLSNDTLTPTRINNAKAKARLYKRCDGEWVPLPRSHCRSRPFPAGLGLVVGLQGAFEPAMRIAMNELASTFHIQRFSKACGPMRWPRSAPAP
jgi:hypothetical protein